MEKLFATLTGIGGITGTLSGQSMLSGTLSRPDIVPVDEYEGPYVFTPTNQTQIIPISGKQATENITIKPIPNNYGLITWNGSTLTVS